MSCLHVVHYAHTHATLYTTTNQFIRLTLQIQAHELCACCFQVYMSVVPNAIMPFFRRAQDFEDDTNLRIAALEAAFPRLGLGSAALHDGGQETWNNNVFVAETQDFAPGTGTDYALKADVESCARKEDVAGCARKSDLDLLVTKTSFDACISELSETCSKLRAQLELMAGQSGGAVLTSGGRASSPLRPHASRTDGAIETSGPRRSTIEIGPRGGGSGAIEMSGRPEPELVSPSSSPRVQLRSRALGSSADDERWSSTLLDRVMGLETRTDTLEKALNGKSSEHRTGMADEGDASKGSSAQPKSAGEHANNEQRSGPERLDNLETTSQNLAASIQQLTGRLDEMSKAPLSADVRRPRSLSSRFKAAEEGPAAEGLGPKTEDLSLFVSRLENVEKTLQDNKPGQGQGGAGASKPESQQPEVSSRVANVEKELQGIDERIKDIQSRLDSFKAGFEEHGSLVQIQGRTLPELMEEELRAFEHKVSSARQADADAFSKHIEDMCDVVVAKVRDGDVKLLHEQLEAVKPETMIMDQAGVELLINDLRDEMLHHLRELEEIVLSSSAVSGEHLAELHTFATREVEIHAKIRELHEELKKVQEKNNSTRANEEESAAKQIEAVREQARDAQLEPIRAELRALTEKLDKQVQSAETKAQEDMGALKRQVLSLSSKATEDSEKRSHNDLEAQRTKNDIDALMSRLVKLEHAGETTLAFGNSIEELEGRVRECERIAAASERLETLTESFQVSLLAALLQVLCICCRIYTTLLLLDGVVTRSNGSFDQIVVGITLFLCVKIEYTRTHMWSHTVIVLLNMLLFLFNSFCVLYSASSPQCGRTQ
jgi:DNA repair exonuclease SbcCD ATPase subunit